MKRTLDLVFSMLMLTVAIPVCLVFSVLIWGGDFHSPVYLSWRVGRNHERFRIIKLRSMVAGADKIGGAHVKEADQRVTSIGRFIRRFKIDELPQLINVLIGHMSIVGPRPEPVSVVARLSKIERDHLYVRPGLTGLSSIIFINQGRLLNRYDNVDDAYQNLIRPIKSRCTLFYRHRRTLMMDFELILFTGLALFSHDLSILVLLKRLEAWGAPKELIYYIRNRDRLEFIPLPDEGYVKQVEMGSASAN